LRVTEGIIVFRLKTAPCSSRFDGDFNEDRREGARMQVSSQKSLIKLVKEKSLKRALAYQHIASNMNEFTQKRSRILASIIKRASAN